MKYTRCVGFNAWRAGAVFIYLVLVTSIVLSLTSNVMGELQPLPSIPAKELLSAPIEIEIDGKHYALTTYLWINVMPGATKALNASVTVRETEGKDIPADLVVPRVWVIEGNSDVWEEALSEEAKRANTSEIKLIARKGPLLGRTPVDVIVQITYNGQSYLLRVTKQKVEIVA